MKRLETSTLSNQSLVTALLCHTHTADADRKVYFRLFADQCAGGGDYVAYLTIQRLGAGSFYRVVPKTSATVEAGVTSICLTTIAVPVKSTDVVRVYLTGLAGDTTTPDIVTEVWEDDATLNSVWTDAKAGYLTGAVALEATAQSILDDTGTAGVAVSPTGVAAIWAILRSGTTTFGSIGKAISDMYCRLLGREHFDKSTGALTVTDPDSLDTVSTRTVSETTDEVNVQ